jgi:hypothetical protein
VARKRLETRGHVDAKNGFIGGQLSCRHRLQCRTSMDKPKLAQCACALLQPDEARGCIVNCASVRRC